MLREMKGPERSAQSAYTSAANGFYAGTFEGDLASGLLCGAIKREASIALGDNHVASCD